MTSPADIPGAYVRDVIALCARWQVPAAALTRGLPITAAALDAPTTRVPIEVCAEVVARAHRLTREPALALYAGWQMRLSTHGYLGFAALTANSAWYDSSSSRRSGMLGIIRAGSRMPVLSTT